MRDFLIHDITYYLDAILVSNATQEEAEHMLCLDKNTSAGFENPPEWLQDKTPGKLVDYLHNWCPGFFYITEPTKLDWKSNEYLRESLSEEQIVESLKTMFFKKNGTWCAEDGDYYYFTSILSVTTWDPYWYNFQGKLGEMLNPIVKDGYQSVRIAKKNINIILDQYKEYFIRNNDFAGIYSTVSSFGNKKLPGLKFKQGIKFSKGVIEFVQELIGSNIFEIIKTKEIMQYHTILNEMWLHHKTEYDIDRLPLSGMAIINPSIPYGVK